MKKAIINKITISLKDLDLITLKAILNVITNHEKSNKCSIFGTSDCISSHCSISNVSEVVCMNSTDNNRELIEKIIELLNANKSETSALKVIYELLIRL